MNKEQMKHIANLISQDIEKDKEIERLNKRVKECEEAYLRTRHQYSELENKYLTDEYIINELGNYLNEQVDYMTHHSIERMVAFDCCRHKLQELRGTNDTK